MGASYTAARPATGCAGTWCDPSLATGPSAGITAQDILLDAPLNVRSVVAFLTGSNGEVDFQNIGFTATVSQVPLPAGVWLLVSALAGMGFLRRR